MKTIKLLSIMIMSTAVSFGLGTLLMSHFIPTGTLEGKVIEASNGDPIGFADVAVYQNGQLITGAQTDFDGNYSISNIDVGTYDVEASYTGLRTTRISKIIVHPNQITRLNFKMEEEHIFLDLNIAVTEYKVPLIDKGKTSSGKTLTHETIRNLPTKNINALAGSAAGISSTDGGDIRIRGSRTNPTYYYIDGNRVANASLIPHGIKKIKHHHPVVVSPFQDHHPIPPTPNTEEYEFGKENAFIPITQEALTTFSIDVDRASYSNIRRMIDYGQVPPSDAVRIEEMINYFDYGYKPPTNGDVFKVHHELTECPWNSKHEILHIALKGKEVDMDNLPPTNLVFLMDVSGSMSSANKLPLVKSSLKILLEKLRPTDKVSIVVYAGAAGTVLEPTEVKDKQKILDALDNLKSGGSTAGGAGIKLAYKLARQHFIQKGNNRVILTTDGDFNVGINSPDDLEKMIEKERKSGVFLSVLGFGMGNYKDNRMERLADKGNGNYAYIDNMQEALKIFKTEFSGTMYAIAKDVKIQIEFNPAFVQAYRLIGYENRMLAKEDFNDDTKDAGELGMGHTVTSLYEIVRTGVKSNYSGVVDPLKFQETKKKRYKNSSDLAVIKLRWKKPDEDHSTKIEEMISPEVTSLKKANEPLRFSMAVAEFGMLLKQSSYKGKSNFGHVIDMASKAKKYDPEGYRSEFIRLVKSAQLLADVD